MRFYLGTHMADWLAKTEVPLFVSRRRLAKYKRRLPVAAGRWALDSGGFTELSQYGEWRISEAAYVRLVRRFAEEIGGLDWVAPMDWMCEPEVLAKTGLSVYHHQERTVGNFIRLRAELGPLVIPVLQGWTLDDYLACWDEYAEQGVELADEPLVGVGSVCRRQSTVAGAHIFERLWAEGLALHGFGIKAGGFGTYDDCLVSADSLAWSTRARYAAQADGEATPCGLTSCSNCLHFALDWRDRLLGREPLRLWGDPCAAA